MFSLVITQIPEDALELYETLKMPGRFAFSLTDSEWIWGLYDNIYKNKRTVTEESDIIMNNENMLWEVLCVVQICQLAIHCIS